MTALLTAIKHINDLYKLIINIFESGWTGKLLIIGFYFFPILVVYLMINKFLKAAEEKIDQKYKTLVELIKAMQPCTGDCLTGMLESFAAHKKRLEQLLETMPHDTDLKDITLNIKVLSGIVDTMKAILISWGGKN